MALRKTIDTILRKLEKEFATHNRIEVSHSAIIHNLNLFSNVSGLQIIPVLKGNAYGHGIAQVAKALHGQTLPYIAVDGYFEALRVREVTDQAVLIMGAIKPENYARLTYDNFAFVVHDATSITALGKTGKRIRLHLEVNTGMNRYGAKPTDIRELAKLVLRYKNLKLEGVMSHLADSDGDTPATVNKAVEQFDACIELVHAAGGKPTILHIAQTAGSIKAHSKYANTMRLGVGLYGINPFPNDHTLYARLNGLKPALRLVSTITKVIELPKGDRVGYNYTFTAPHTMRIGILPLGYYEGLNRQLSNSGAVLKDASAMPIVGKVCMNHTMISLENSTADVGDEVVVYSNNPSDANSIASISQHHNLFSYNLLTALSPDVRRTLIE